MFPRVTIIMILPHVMEHLPYAMFCTKFWGKCRKQKSASLWAHGADNYETNDFMNHIK